MSYLARRAYREHTGSAGQFLIPIPFLNTFGPLPFVFVFFSQEEEPFCRGHLLDLILCPSSLHCESDWSNWSDVSISYFFLSLLPAYCRTMWLLESKFRTMHWMDVFKCPCFTWLRIFRSWQSVFWILLAFSCQTLTTFFLCLYFPCQNLKADSFKLCTVFWSFAESTMTQKWPFG